MAGPNVVVSVLADTQQFRRNMGQLDSVGKRVSGALGKIAKVGGALLLAATVAVGGFLASSIKAAGELEKISAQTNAVLESTRGIAGKTAESVNRLAGELSFMSGVDDELIKKSQNLLLTFTNIRGTTFDAATKSALDMSVALGTDLQSASTLVGKALNDPIRGVTALTRVGVTFTDQQRDQIAQMVAVGDTAGAQALILRELQTEFGGSAEAFGQTWEGAVGRFKSLFGDIQQTIGGAFLPAMTAGLNAVSDVLIKVAESPAFASIVNGIGQFVTSLFEGTGAGAGFAEAFSVISAVLNPFGVVLQALLPVLPSLADSFSALGAALGGALASVLPTVSTLLDAIVGALSGVLAAVLPTIIGLITQLADIFAALMPALTPVIELLAGILSGALVRLVPIIATVAEFIGGMLSTALEALSPLLTLAAEFLGSVLEAASPLIDVVLSLLEAFAPLLPVIGELIGAILPPLAELLIALLEPILGLVAPILDLLVPAIQFLADVLGAIVGVVVGVLEIFVGLITGSEDTQRKVVGIWQGVLNFFKGIPKAIGDFFAGAVNWLRDAGVNIVQGLLNGIRSMAGQIGQFFLNLLPGWIIGPFKAALGIASPSRVFRALGVTLPQGLVAGVGDGLSSVRRAAGNLANAAVGGFDSPAFSPSFATAGNAGGRCGGLTIVLPGAVYLTKAEIGRAIREALDEFERLNGGRPA